MRASLSLMIVLSLGAVSLAVAADDGKNAFTDPEEAGIDYKIQGEYAGFEQNKTKWGAQVIALGDGKFRGVGFPGGLPGDGWKRGDEMKSAEGKLEGEAAILKEPGDDDIEVRVDGETLTVSNKGEVFIEMKKVHRKSPTLGMKGPEGMKAERVSVLFDGTSAEAWENGKIVEGDLLAASNCSTKKKFGDHTLHIEFRTPFMPAAGGQGRGNSGVYVHGRYEVQVLDSFGLEGKDNECGGIYKIAQPDVNMCLPPLAWQTYDIDFTAARYDDSGKKTKNARITIRHNGVVIHDDIELPKETPGRHAEGPQPDSLFLQDHGNPVVFRNIWVVEK